MSDVHDREYLCPSCSGRKRFWGYYNWRVHVRTKHGGEDPRLPSAVNEGIKAVDSASAPATEEFTCTWDGCEKTFTKVETFYSHTHVTHKVDYPHAKDVPLGLGALQEDIDDGFQNYLFLSDSYRDYCRERGIEP